MHGNSHVLKVRVDAPENHETEKSEQQFASSRLKIKRAYRHIQELESAFQAFVKTDFCRAALTAGTLR